MEDILWCILLGITFVSLIGATFMNLTKKQFTDLDFIYIIIM